MFSILNNVQVDLPKNLFPDPGEEPNAETMVVEACNEVK